MILFLIHYIHLICLIVNIDINPCWGYLWGRLWILWVYLPAFILKWAQLAVFLDELEPLLLIVGVALVWGSSTSQNAHWFAISTIRHVGWVHVHLQIIEYGWFNGTSLWTKYVIAVLGLHHLWIRIGIIFHFHWLLLLRSDDVLSGLGYLNLSSSDIKNSISLLLVVTAWLTTSFIVHTCEENLFNLLLGNARTTLTELICFIFFIDIISITRPWVVIRYFWDTIQADLFPFVLCCRNGFGFCLFNCYLIWYELVASFILIVAIELLPALVDKDGILRLFELDLAWCLLRWLNAQLRHQVR